MTLAASKVVVAEQMKIQGTSSSQLALMFKQEIDQIQKDFTDKIYWKISQPKVYLHQIDNCKFKKKEKHQQKFHLNFFYSYFFSVKKYHVLFVIQILMILKIIFFPYIKYN